MATHGTSFTLAQFIDGKIHVFNTSIGQDEYFAISHVWGSAEWRRVSCFDREILVSSHKARFIEEQLTNLVGSIPFWMDVLSVNQSDQTKVVAVTQDIPSIFRNAKKTIAIREPNGLKDCCALAIQGLSNWEEIHKKIMDHSNNNTSDHKHHELFLQRLWTLQECFLSQTIQFVTCNQGTQYLRLSAEPTC